SISRIGRSCSRAGWSWKSWWGKTRAIDCDMRDHRASGVIRNHHHAFHQAHFTISDGTHSK
ncbi:hypothetical protein N9198_04250, partial [Akkermansiaceae bacterium]|nr:hypothetical protein [Akkermansiaceae bacterium]